MEFAVVVAAVQEKLEKYFSSNNDFTILSRQILEENVRNEGLSHAKKNLITKIINIHLHCKKIFKV